MSAAGVGGEGVRVTVHDSADAAPFRDRVLEVWTLTFGPVEDEDDWRGRFWEQHRTRDGFRLVTAEHESELVGFAWGYTGHRGQWWADMVAETLGTDAEGWLGGHLEFVELAVLPDCRRRGIGGQLHDALLQHALLQHALLQDSSSHDPSRQCALLQTDANSSSAGHRLYLARGWHVLGALAGGKVVMGKRLR